MLIIGGIDISTVFDSKLIQVLDLETLDLDEESHKSQPFSLTTLKHAAATIDENTLYRLGGAVYDRDHKWHESKSIYTLKDSKWSKLATTLASARHGAMSIKFGNKLFLIGGKTTLQKRNPVTTVEAYDIESNMWENHTHLPHGVRDGVMCKVKGVSDFLENMFINYCRYYSPW